MRLFAAIYPFGAHFAAAFTPTISWVWAAGNIPYYESEQFPPFLDLTD
jgi:hypothetical protein